jgi:hypothetical protein
MKKYLTRLTPNFNKWEKPSGEDGKCGAPFGPPYEGINGFGWEEWFLNDYHNPENQLDGYCYGFIQAFHKMNKAKEKIDRLYLYTKVCNKKSKSVYYLGYIDNVEVLNQPFNQKELIDKKNKFCQKVESDLAVVNITGYKKDLVEMCSEDTLFNVRFKSQDVHIQDFNFENRPIKLPHGWYRFRLYDLDKMPFFNIGY